MNTDTTRLAAAIAAFEREFPTLRWSVGQTTGAFVLCDFNLEASSFEVTVAADKADLLAAPTREVTP